MTITPNATWNSQMYVAISRTSVLVIQNLYSNSDRERIELIPQTTANLGNGTLYAHSNHSYSPSLDQRLFQLGTITSRSCALIPTRPTRRLSTKSFSSRATSPSSSTVLEATPLTSSGSFRARASGAPHSPLVPGELHLSERPRTMCQPFSAIHLDLTKHVLLFRFNFAYEIDFTGNTVGLWASTGGAALTKVVANVATTAYTVSTPHSTSRPSVIPNWLFFRPEL